jgi:copper resistance protein B
VPESNLGAGLTSGNFDLRLLYEHRREFAPYVGVRYHTLFGETANIATRDGREEEELQFVLGVRISF